MNNEKIFRAIGQINDDKILEADVCINKIEKSVRPAIQKWVPIAAAACLLITTAVYTLPGFMKTPEADTRSTDHNEIITSEEIPGRGVSDGEVAILEDYLDIYYITIDGAILSESIMLRFTAEDIFAKWAEMNSLTGVTLIKAFYSSNGTETVHGEGDTAVVQYEVGDHFTLTLTVSHKFQNYIEGENGALLLESLEMTFGSYLHYDEPILIINES